MRTRYLLRSKLFVPGNRPDLFSKALRSAVDAVSFDLEDAVHPSLKSSARKTLADFIKGDDVKKTDKLIIIRINDLSKPEAPDDIKAVVSPRLDIVNIPKVESCADIKKAVALLRQEEEEQGMTRQIAILANIETPKGLRCAAEIACADSRVMGLQIGFADLFGALGVNRQDLMATHQVRLSVRIAAGEAGIDAYDAAFLNIKDHDALRAEAQISKQLGFAGKSCIHPSQIEPVNDVFMPSDIEITQARELLEYARLHDQSGEGVFVFNGQMIDKPVIEAAERIVQLSTINR
ncbi:HpcH/HpaI aldolase/citrate lyase family protein [Pelobacter seleniigenes]|uniref:HpcH/HpaI aldolase/citrate lyase family protein n=1 Tax=Pelobacter seleniigenes TaxID=407188 RepID=UPI0004A7574A|nr:CoA ester lyase [Pelobacter seleniigenes]